MSAEKAKELGVPVLATIKSYASAGLDPKSDGVAVQSTHLVKHLKKVDLQLQILTW